MTIFTGVGVALITVRDARDRPDAGATGDLAARLVGRGMRAVLACGTTGEAGHLTDQERSEIVAAVREAVPRDVPVIAGTGATSAARAAELTSAAAQAGADAVLAWPPPDCDGPGRLLRCRRLRRTRPAGSGLPRAVGFGTGRSRRFLGRLAGGWH